MSEFLSWSFREVLTTNTTKATKTQRQCQETVTSLPRCSETWSGFPVSSRKNSLNAVQSRFSRCLIWSCQCLLKNQYWNKKQRKQQGGAEWAEPVKQSLSGGQSEGGDVLGSDGVLQSPIKVETLTAYLIFPQMSRQWNSAERFVGCSYYANCTFSRLHFLRWKQVLWQADSAFIL